jgi:hypothetical protein
MNNDETHSCAEASLDEDVKRATHAEDTGE